MLNDKENEKYNIIEKVVNGTMTRKEAMCELKKSRQQIYRLIKLYYSEGKEGFIWIYVKFLDTFFRTIFI